MQAYFTPLFIIIASGLLLLNEAVAVEYAPYDVLLEDNAYEVRVYQNLVLVTAPMNDEKGQRSAFRKLFRYISGNNDNEQDIAMTAPVLMDESLSGNRFMAFVLPGDMAMADVPQPLESDVLVREIAEMTVATIRFSGRMSDNNILKHREQLFAWVEDKQLRVVGKAKTAGYNAPYTLPFLRRNEIMVPVELPEGSDLSSIKALMQPPGTK